MKRYVLEVTADENGALSIKGENRGFSAFEIVGFLMYKVEDLAKQITAARDGGSPQMERIFITERIVEKKNDKGESK